LFFLSKGITPQTAILIDWSHLSAWCPHSYVGRFLTASGQFIDYEIELNDDQSALEHIDFFGDVTDQVEVLEHKRGIGKTAGWIARELLEELLGR
jgi:hypothetical protein